MPIIRGGAGGGGGVSLKRYLWSGALSYQIPNDATDIIFDPQMTVGNPQGTITQLEVILPVTPVTPSYISLHFGGAIPIKNRVVQGIKFTVGAGQQLLQLVNYDAVNSIVYSGDVIQFYVDARNGTVFFHRTPTLDEMFKAILDDQYLAHNGPGGLLKLDGSGYVPALPLTPFTT